MSDADALVETLRRWDRPAPRYTSYPPANHFHALTAEEYAAALQRAAAAPEAPLSLYVHLPFCHRRCAYCGCHSLAGAGRDGVTAYLDDLEREVGAVAGRLGARRDLLQLQWGGGTPNYLEPAELERGHRILADAFTLAPDAEQGVELDPSSLTPEQLETLKDLGFNRISLGVQDLDPEVQRLIGRGQTAAETRTAYELCRSLGFPSVHLDLVYGLPGQSRESLRQTLTEVAELGPDRLSLFGFAYLPRLRPNQAVIPADTVPSTDLRAHLYADAVARLTGAGYVRIGMDHFARPHDELALAQAAGTLRRNFQGYTTLPAEDQVGFGISAISDVAGCYAQDAKDLAAYHAAATAGGLATVRGLVLDDDDRLRRAIITELMCNSRVRFADIEARFPAAAPFAETFAAEISRLDELAREGLVAVDDAGIQLAPEAWPLVRLAASAFDAYLHGRAPAEPPRYSTVV